MEIHGERLYSLKNTIQKHLFIVSVLFLFLSACASAPKPKEAEVFFPSPPELPRIQYLTSLTGEKDIARKKSAFEAFITGSSASDRRLDKPYGIATWGGKIYVCDLNQGVIIFDLAKRTYGGLQGAQGMGKLVQPVNIRIAPDGLKYVSDPVRSEVVVFDKNDFYVGSFGMPGTWKPVDAVPYQDELYVADIENSRIVVMDRKKGTVNRYMGNTGDPAGVLSRPTNISFNSLGHLFVSDAGRFQIMQYDRDGHFLGSIGGLGAESGRFARPRGIALDRKDDLYAVDAAFGNVQIFSPEGYLLLFFGTTGYNPGDMNLPSQIIMDYDDIPYFQKFADPNFEIDHLIIVANQFGSKMIGIYAAGKERGKQYPSDAELLKLLKERMQKALQERVPENKSEPTSK